MLLQEALGEDAEAAVAGWDGSQYVFLSDGAGTGLFAIEIVWDSADEAAEGGQAIAVWLEANGFTDQGADWSATDGRSAFLKSDGDRVYRVVGSQPTDVQTLLAKLGW